ncbi:hypothetical protein KY285_023498 [Solanum tuberosum]|nr:hypothetical protein KY289_023831 [Solanum tuberosum]KAH0675697.1 hypothetical protein KY285_023498 [Solanum tuberosum]
MSSKFLDVVESPWRLQKMVGSHRKLMDGAISILYWSRCMLSDVLEVAITGWRSSEMAASRPS